MVQEIDITIQVILVRKIKSRSFIWLLLILKTLLQAKNHILGISMDIS